MKKPKPTTAEQRMLAAIFDHRDRTAAILTRTARKLRAEHDIHKIAPLMDRLAAELAEIGGNLNTILALEQERAASTEH